MRQEFENFYYLTKNMIKATQTLLFDKQSVIKRWDDTKKEKKTNNPASPKNGFIPGGDASRADVPFQLPLKLGPATLPRTKISSQLVVPEEIPT